MDVTVLGPVTARVEGSAIALGGAGGRATLAMLALAAPRVVAPGELIDGLWHGDASAGAMKLLQNRIRRLRAAFADAGATEPVIATHGGGYRYAAAPETVDVHRVHALLRQADAARGRGDAQLRARLLDEAASAWSGEPLSGVGDVPFALLATSNLVELRWSVIEQRVDAHLDCAEHHELIAELQALVGAAPLRERLWQQLMLALYRSGRQAEALDAFRTLRRQMRQDHGLDPGAETVKLHSRIAAGDLGLAAPAPAPSAERRRTPRLPRLRTRFIGRQRDIVEVQALLRRSGCVTITGPAGVGKTRLALEVARQFEAGHPDTVAMVELAAIADGAHVPAQIAAALGMTTGADAASPLDDIISALTGLRGLVVLDNCEHVIDAAAQAARLLSQALPDLQLVCTSREPLRFDGEAVWRLAPLHVPSGDAGGDPDAIGEVASVRLFLDRAQLRRPELELHAGTAQLVARVATALDGLPLALELAAGALDVLELSELVETLDDRFATVASGQRGAPARHETLHAAIDWSYQLLAPVERDLFERLGVFVAAVDLDVVTRVTGGDPQDTELLLTRLAERSLVERLGGRDASYRLLDSIRSFARTRLLSRVAPADAYRPLWAWACETARAAADSDRTGDSAVLARIERVYPLLRGALQACLDLGNQRTAQELVLNLSSYWLVRGPYDEARAWHDRVLATGIDDAGSDSADRASLLVSAAKLPVNDGSSALSMLQRAVAIARRVGDDELLANTLVAFASCDDGTTPEKERALDEALTLANRIGARDVEAEALEVLGMIRAMQGRHADAVAYLRQAEDVLPSGTFPVKAFYIKTGLSQNLFCFGQFEQARAAIADALAAAREMGYRYGELWALTFRGQLELGTADADAGLSSLDEASALARDLDYVVFTPWIRGLQYRAELGRGNLAAAVTALADPAADRPSRKPLSFARQVCLAAAATGLASDAAMLLACLDREPSEEFDDPQQLQDMEWVRQLDDVAAAGSPEPIAGDLTSCCRRVLKRVLRQPMLLHQPPLGLAAARVPARD
jgi:predicted ATPase/DNA-binding SARP family transcriptional activator